MTRHRHGWASRLAAHALCLLIASATAAAPGAARAAQGTDPVAGTAVSLKILNARAPAGGVMQLNVTLTEPTPILVGQGVISFSSVGSVLGVALFSPAGVLSDVVGTAVIGAGGVTLRSSSPSAQFGSVAGTPILAVAIGVPATTPVGTRGALSMDLATSLFLDPAGTPYPQTVKNGSFVIGGTLNVGNVSPALGLLPAGSTVTVQGMGFLSGAIVEIDDVPVASTTFVSPTELLATIAAPADLYGRDVTVINADLARASYYAYPRTAWLAPSAHRLLAATDPIFSPLRFSRAVWANTARAGQFVALALQNAVGTAPANVTVELRTAARVIASTPVPLPAMSRIERDLSELFPGTAVPADAVLAVRSDIPVQMLGMLGDDAAGTIEPLTPSLAIP
jgi:IPT/TIG domain-containing protein